jgi:ELWxxDGT repeat protein
MNRLYSHRGYAPLSILILLCSYLTAQNAPTLVKDINPGAASSNPTSLVLNNNAVYFMADDGSGKKIFRSDGTANGTQNAQINVQNGPFLSSLISFNGGTYFFNNGFNASLELWRLNGNTPTLVTRLDSMITLSVTNIQIANNELYFTAVPPDPGCNGGGQIKRIYRTNGNVGGMRYIGSLNNNCVTGGGGGGNTTVLGIIGQSSFTVERTSSSNFSPVSTNTSGFSLRDELGNSRELFYSESNNISGVVTSFERGIGKPIGFVGNTLFLLQKDSLFSVTFATQPVFIKSGCGITANSYFKQGNLLYFTNNRGELWRTDGTTAGTLLLKSGTATPSAAAITDPQLIGSTFYFNTRQPRGPWAVWRIDPTATTLTLDTTILGGPTPVFQLATINNELYSFLQNNTSSNNPSPVIISKKVNGFWQVLGEVNGFDRLNYAVLNNDLLLNASATGIPSPTGQELYKFPLGPSVSTTYCAAKGTLPWEYWVGNVNFNTINNTSDKFKDFATLGYSDYTNLSTTLNKGQNYPLSITSGLSWIGNLPNAYARVWIDFNQNKTFEANELVLEKTNANPLTQSILIPTTALTGATRMRVAVKFGAYPTACETFDKGEVEDYTVNITEGVQNLPDLTLANLTLPPNPVQETELLKWKVDIKNIGTGNASSNFSVKAYVSTDNILSADDRLYSTIPTGNFAAGFSVPQVSDSTTTPRTIPAGQYYLIAKADADNTIVESNENNNVLVSATKFTVLPTVQTGCRYQDSLQLVSFYNATGGANWTNKWNLAMPINTWYGVTLDANGCVNGVFATDQNLVGTLPNLNLPKLEQLYLISNIRLTGTLPNFNLPALTQLHVYNNGLSGAIPNFNAPNLTHFIASTNLFTGAVPPFSAANFPKIRYIVLSGNKLTGTIPNFSSPTLYQLELGGNLLTGGIPNFNTPNLVILGLEANQLIGSIPNFNLPLLTVLYLNNNGLGNALPNFNLPSLNNFDVSNNNLVGCLPPALRTMCSNPSALVNLSGNPQLATQDFAAFCSNNTGACNQSQTDLSAKINAVSFSSNYNAITFDGTVTSRSNVNVNNVTVRIYISRDTNISADDKLLWSYPFSFAAAPIDISYNVPFDSLPWTSGTGTFYVIFIIDEANIIVETNKQNNKSVYQLIVNPTTAASDIALSLTSTPSVFTKYTPLNFNISAKNTGSQPFTNVKVEFKFPTNTTSGGTATPSVGTWQEWCAGGIQCFTWTIPTLAANGTASLNVPVYVLNAIAPIVATAKLLASTPTDNVVANNTATVTVNPATGAVPLAQAQATQLIPIVIQRIAPNPSDGEVIVELESLDARVVQFDFSNSIGSTILSEKRAVEKGMNRVLFDVSELPQGVYFVSPTTHQGRKVPTKFVKL